jgi:hypothetical protein
VPADHNGNASACVVEGGETSRLFGADVPTLVVNGWGLIVKRSRCVLATTLGHNEACNCGDDLANGRLEL